MGFQIAGLRVGEIPNLRASLAPLVSTARVFRSSWHLFWTLMFFHDKIMASKELHNVVGSLFSVN